MPQTGSSLACLAQHDGRPSGPLEVPPPESTVQGRPRRGMGSCPTVQRRPPASTTRDAQLDTGEKVTEPRNMHQHLERGKAQQSEDAIGPLMQSLIK